MLFASFPACPRLWHLTLGASLWLGCAGTQSSAQLPTDAPARAPADPPEAAAASALLVSATASEGSSPAQRASSAPAAVTGAPEPRALPNECKRKGELCLPARDFVRRLCSGAFMGATFHLLQKGTPFSRGYVRADKVPPVNTLGGPSSDAKLQFGEEVLILTRTGESGPNQMQVSGMGGYDVLRWDGTCANLADGELALRAPIPPKHAPIEWRDIDSPIQTALLEDAGIREARKTQRQHCHGVSLGTRTAECEKADARLVDRIVSAVRSGFELPALENIP